MSQICCSRSCGTKHGARFSRKTKVFKKCEICETGMNLWPCKSEFRFCSIKCRGIAKRINRLHKCKGCGIQFSHVLEDRAFCSDRCKKENYKGRLTSNWKGGTTKGRSLLRTQIEKWRLAVFTRDSFKCTNCNAAERTDIHAHHIKPWADFPSLRFDVRNGQTLCIDCHGKIHNLDFRKRLEKRKTCKKCGVKISGKGKLFLCRACASFKIWENRRSIGA